MSELKRTYHGVEIVSRMNTEPVADSDGFTHEVLGQTVKTLGEAIQVAKTKPKRQAKKEKE